MHDLAEPISTAIMAPQPTQEQVRRLEAIILQAPQTDLKTRHFVLRSPLGVTLYGREITVPAGVILTGAAHRLDHMAVCTGDITVSTDAGMQRLTGHCTFTAKAGHKRVGIAHADTTWTTFHVVQADNIEAIEEELSDEFDMLQTRRGLLPVDVRQLIGSAA